MAEERRDTAVIVLRVIAVLIALRSLGNLGKPFGTGSGLMFFGFLLKGPVMWVLAPLVGLYDSRPARPSKTRATPCSPS